MEKIPGPGEVMEISGKSLERSRPWNFFPWSGTTVKKSSKKKVQKFVTEAEVMQSAGH